MRRRPYEICKRLLDLAAVSVGGLAISPVLVAIALLIKTDSRGPVIFRQRRLGRAGVPFTLYKFRTMRTDAREVRNQDGSCFTSNDDPRLTRIGKILRETSLDELPQIFNVLRGEMTLVGPRPDLEAQLALYDDLFKKKLLVRPGLTSLPAVMGRNSLSWRERASLDAWYVDHRSLKLDIAILFKTVLAVFGRDGIYTANAGGSANTEWPLAPSNPARKERSA